MGRLYEYSHMKIWLKWIYWDRLSLIKFLTWRSFYAFGIELKIYRVQKKKNFRYVQVNQKNVKEKVKHCLKVGFCELENLILENFKLFVHIPISVFIVEKKTVYGKCAIVIFQVVFSLSLSFHFWIVLLDMPYTSINRSNENS